MSSKTAQPTKPAPSFMVKAQYIKDLSFENPHAPESLLAIDKPPAIDVGVDLKARKLEGNLFETILNVSARAIHGENTLFLVELSYGGVFEINNVPPEHIEMLLMVDCPFVLFPFARRVIADTSRDGGYPPLMLDPIDFHSMYLQKREQASAGAK